jgi:cytidine deaminase
MQSHEPGPPGSAPSQQAIDRLIELARQAATGAHAPYSQFHVGAAVLTARGAMYTGCNVENASYGLTICAERLAIWKAVSEGHKEIAAIVVYTPTTTVTPPCGACRQVAAEFAGDAATVICASNGELRRHTVGELLPGAFRPSNLAE